MISKKLFVAGLLNDDFKEAYYIIDLVTRETKELLCDNSMQKTNLLKMIDSQFEEDNIPYDLSKKSFFLPYLINPHSSIKVGNKMLSFMLQAPYFREVDLNTLESREVAFKVGDVETIFSASSGGFVDNGKIYISVNSAVDRADIYKGKKREMEFELYEYDVSKQKFTLCSEKFTGLIDNMHQVGYSKNEFIVALDMNISVDIEGVKIRDLDNKDIRIKYGDANFPVGKIFIYDLLKKRFLQIVPPLYTPAHVEFDPDNPNIFYVSCHNMSKFKSNMILHGPGLIVKYEYNGVEINELRNYSDKYFYRITTHKIFKYKENTYIAVTGYPNYLYIINAQNMMLEKKIKLFNAEKCIELEDNLFVCTGNQDATLYLQISEDGTEVYLVNSRKCFVVQWDAGLVESFDYTQSDFSVSGHIEIF